MFLISIHRQISHYILYVFIGWVRDRERFVECWVSAFQAMNRQSIMQHAQRKQFATLGLKHTHTYICLLYTSDAADE